MKKLTIIVAALLMLGTSAGSFAQQVQQSNAPHAIKYQAVARDSKGDVISNQNVSFRISIVEGTETGTTVYQETQNAITNQFGLANLAIGKGTLTSGNFNDIQWGEDNYFVKVEFDPQGGTNYALMGTSQMLSVPYALYAERSSYTDNIPEQVSLVAANLSEPIKNPPTGMIIYNTAISGTAPYDVTPGLYFNAGSPLEPNWVPLGTKHSNYSRTGRVLVLGSGNTTYGGISQDGGCVGSGAQGNATSCPTGGENTGFGTGTFGLNTTNPSGNNNTAVGYNSMNNITSGGNNTGIGEAALVNITTAADNTAAGIAQAWLIDGVRNTAVGNYALDDQQHGSSNTAVGFAALDGPVTNWSGSWNTAVGDSALASNTGSKNVAVGYAAEAAVTSGLHNTAVGYEALNTITTGSSNTAVGYEALFKNTGIRNTAVGDSALWTNTTGKANNALGYGALQVNTTGNQNEAIGNGVLVSNTTGSANTACGHSTLDDNTTGYYNTALGYDALNFSTTASSNTALGANSLENMGNGTGVSNFNTAVGDSALYNNTTGLNTGTGYGALVATTSGTHNTADGYKAAYSSTTASGITADGYEALNQSTGDFNTALGDSALYSNTSGTSNTGLGYHADVSTNNLTYAVAIGATSTVNKSNSLILGGTTSTNYTFVGIGNNAPKAELHLTDASTNSATNSHIKIDNDGTAPTTTNDTLNGFTGSSITSPLGNPSADAKGIITLTGTENGTGTAYFKVTYNKAYNASSVPTITITGLENASKGYGYFIETSGPNFFILGIYVLNTTLAGAGPSFFYHVIE